MRARRCASAVVSVLVPSLTAMRFLHTSDWHLGRSFHGVGLLAAQAEYLDHLVGVAEAEAVEAVLVSGDIYDRALPSPDAVRLLDDTLVRLRETGAQVVISSGNHDSAARLGFGARILRSGGVHVRTDLAGIAEPVAIGGVDIYPLPYLEPSVVADRLGAEQATHAGVLRAAMRQVETARGSRPGRAAVVMAHTFVTGSTSSDSERDISVGGLAAVPRQVFETVDYAALGHLHRPQQLGDRIRYSGAPVAMSFSEAGQQKVSLLVDLDAADCTVREIPAPVGRPLAVLRGELEHLLADPAHDVHRDAWVQVTLTDTRRPARAMERLQERFPHCLQLLFDTPARLGSPVTYAQRIGGRSDLDLCCDFLDHVRERPADDTERGLLARSLEAATTARRDDDAEGQAGASAVVA